MSASRLRSALVSFLADDRSWEFPASRGAAESLQAAIDIEGCNDARQPPPPGGCLPVPPSAPGAENGKGEQAGGKGMREGDWMCAQCGNHNYSHRTVCNKCGAPKQTSSFGPMKGGGGTGFRVQPYALYSGGKGDGSGKDGGRPGDWICPACGNLNYSSREACNKCAYPRNPPPNFRPGDWICPACTNHNYGSKTSCNKCGTPKPTHMSPPPPGAPPNFRPGDWMCSACGNHNYGSKASCNKCGAPKPDEQSAPPPPTHPPNAPPNFRPGDWMCPACGNHNYAGKLACNRCGAPKPGDESVH